MAFVVIYDACVLYPAPTRDLLLRIANTGIVRARWLERYDIEPKHPDEFVLDSIDLAPGAVVQCVTDQMRALRNPPVMIPELLDTLRRLGLVQSVARLRELLGAA